jgi:hypothetical protein
LPEWLTRSIVPSSQLATWSSLDAFLTQVFKAVLILDDRPKQTILPRLPHF